MTTLEWVGLFGVIGTFGFGAISLIQFVREIINRRVRQNEQLHVEALGNSLAHLRMMCTEAINSGEVIKSDPSRQFVRQIGWELLNAEAHVRAILESLQPKQKGKGGKSHQELPPSE